MPTTTIREAATGDMLLSVTLGQAKIEYKAGEKRIGTWIDGKPLYRDTIYLPANSWTQESATVASIPFDCSDIDTVTRLDATLRNNHYNSQWLLPLSTTAYCSLAIYPASDAIGACIGGSGATLENFVRNCVWVIFVEYTKLSDVAGV